jgi:hypothetical protein
METHLIGAEVEPEVGQERRVRDSLPIGEFLHPVTLTAMAVLALNDHVLKGAGILPGWLTGKLSDIAGLIFFPLLATALLDTVLFGLERLGAVLRKPVSYNPELTRFKLLVSCILTGLAFSAIQLWPPAVELYVALHRIVGVNAAVTADPTDLMALWCLPVAYFVGERFIRTRQNISLI